MARETQDVCGELTLTQNFPSWLKFKLAKIAIWRRGKVGALIKVQFYYIYQ